jgi:Protein of unknown function (DUF2490)
MYFVPFYCAFAQNTPNGGWYAFIGTESLNQKITLLNELQYRNYNLVGDLHQLLLRGGIGYNLTKLNNNILLGYAHVYSQKYNVSERKIGQNEKRIFLQFITRQRFNRAFLQHRYRAERRFLSDDVVQVRLRYLFGLNLPINKKSMDKGAFYLSLSDEIFVHIKSPKFDRNRLYGALGYVITPKLRAEIGFMSQETEATQRGQYQLLIFCNTNSNIIGRKQL